MCVFLSEGGLDVEHAVHQQINRCTANSTLFRLLEREKIADPGLDLPDLESVSEREKRIRISPARKIGFGSDLIPVKFLA